MATRRLPATPILLFQITVNHQTYIVYIHKHQCAARETVVWEYKSSNVGINRFMLLLECVRLVCCDQFQTAIAIWFNIIVEFLDFL